MSGGQDISTAPQDRDILVWAPAREGLPAMFSVCRYHPDAGFCIDEIREPTYWWELPKSPGVKDFEDYARALMRANELYDDPDHPERVKAKQEFENWAFKK